MIAAVRTALETALAAISPALATAYENVPYEPVQGTAYQAVYLLPAEPENREIGTSYTERGILQVSLFYPLDTGPGAAQTRAELIRSTFYRGATFTASGITTHVDRTPEIGPARIEDDRYLVPVRIRFYAHVRN